MSHILREAGPHPAETGESITADIYRFDPSTDANSRMERYIVPYCDRMSVFTLLREIYAYQDQTLGFRNQQCGRGICATCRVNSRTDTACPASLKKPRRYRVSRCRYGA